MKTKILAAGAAAFALTMSATASYAGFMIPGETMGVSLDSPLPEGVFFADLETYGRGDNQPQQNVGVNIPVIIWSTPFSFYNTRLEFLAAFPFAHFDTSAPAVGLNTTAFATWAFGPILAHDFGNGLTGGVSAFVRTPAASTALLGAYNTTEADFRQSMQYAIPGNGPFGFLGGLTFIENAAFTTGFGQQFASQNDMFAGDFALEKTFGKFTIGFTGFGNIDTNNTALGGARTASVELGGLIGYDFGKFSLTGIVTRSVYVRGGNAGVSDTIAGGYETRGWVRIVVPLYVAPTAPVVTARY